MRKLMTKEVTATTVKLSKIEVVEGTPKAIQLDDEILLGNVSLEKAQKEVSKKHGQGVTVFQVLPETKVYEMEVEEFIKLARLKDESEEVSA